MRRSIRRKGGGKQGLNITTVIVAPLPFVDCVYCGNSHELFQFDAYSEVIFAEVVAELGSADILIVAAAAQKLEYPFWIDIRTEWLQSCQALPCCRSAPLRRGKPRRA